MATTYQLQRVRSRPVVTLMSRVRRTVSDPVVLDLGCGDGHSIPILRQHWPNAKLMCLDKSKEMLHQAMSNCIDSRVSFQCGGLEEWEPRNDDEQPDVVVANSVLHLVKNHDVVLQRLMNMITPGGVLALQMPVLDSPLVDALRQASADVGISQAVPSALTQHAPAYYYELLCGHGEVDIWTASDFHFCERDQVLALVKSLGAGGSLWSHFATSIRTPGTLADAFEAAYFDTARCVGNTDKYLVELPRLYIVATKEGHAPTLGAKSL